MKQDYQAEIIAKNIRALMKEKKITQRALARELGIATVTLARYLLATRMPSYEAVQKIADYFEVDKVRIDTTYEPSKTDTVSRLTSLTSKLPVPRQKKVLSYAEREMLDHLEESNEVREPSIPYKIPHLYKVTIHSQVSAGLGYAYDDNDSFEVSTDRDNLPRYDLATEVTGNSMMPDYEAGEILLLCDEGVTMNYNGQLSVVVIDDENYFKKIYTDEDNQELILRSLNPDYNDKSVPFPPSEGEYMKIFRVVDSFMPVEE